MPPQGPVLIRMLHKCIADRRIYDKLAGLPTAGYHVLTFDFRGFGDSRGGAFIDFAKQRAGGHAEDAG